MKNKYYTPEIEEFCVGFECEVYITTQRYGSIKKNEDTETDNADSAFYPMIFGNKNSKCELLVLGELIHTQKLNVDKFRVKYLDKEDIESLGFKFAGGKLMRNYKDDFILKVDEYKQYNLSYTYSNNVIRIDAEDLVTFEATTNYLFQGTIKNISELKLLLKQLNIK